MRNSHQPMLAKARGGVTATRPADLAEKTLFLKGDADAVVAEILSLLGKERFSTARSLASEALARFPDHVRVRRAWGIFDNRGKAKAKPQRSPCSKDVGKSDPHALDELEQEAQTAYRSDTGRVLYIAPGRFDLQYTTKLLGEQISTPLRLGDARLERCARYLAGCAHLSLVFKHEAEVLGSRIPVDSSWADYPDRYSTHAGCEFVGSHLIESWVRRTRSERCRRPRRNSTASSMELPAAS